MMAAFSFYSRALGHRVMFRAPDAGGPMWVEGAPGPRDVQSCRRRGTGAAAGRDHPPPVIHANARNLETIARRWWRKYLHNRRASA